MNTNSMFKKGVNLLTLGSFLLWNLAAAAPEGGSVAGGSATITQSGSQTTINQTSQNAVINWHGFDTAATESVKFTQPNASSIALNRINSGQPTNFQGSLSANGQVWILNPSGVLFGASSKVDVAGLLVTTHNITDSNFMSGNYQFTLDPSAINSKIINNGLISVKDSGIVALVAPGVENNGTIIANLGKVYLSSGSAFVLDMNGDSLINFGSSPAVEHGYVSNSGLIQATGGKVHMTANAAAGVLDNVISMSGTIAATTASTGAHGEIILNGGHAGKVKVSGKLKATNGGMIETSGYDLDLTGAVIDAGMGGTWLLDPPVIYTSTWGTLISDQLNAGTNVTLSTGVSGLGAGDIYLDAPITWGTTAVLMLGAYHDINISAPVSATASGGFIARADLSANGIGTVNFSGSGSVTVNGANGYAKLFYNPTGGNYAAPTNYTGFLLGTAPIKAGYMMINTQANLLAAGAVGSTSIVYSYALNNDIDMTGVPLSSSIFTSNFGNNFKGNFEGHNYADGLNKTISNITLSTGGGGIGSLMTYIDGRIDNLTLNNLSLTAGGNYGGLVWSNNGTISNVHVSGNLVGTSFSGGGGITGENQGVIQNSWFSGSVNSGGNLYIGGITGFLNTGARIINSYNEGAITGSSAGGLVGLMIGVSTITNSYNVGFITGGAALIGAANVAGSTLTGMYWDTTTSGAGTAYTGVSAASYAGTDTPLTDPNMKIAANFPTFDFLNTWTTNGNTTYPKLINHATQVINTTQIAGNLGGAGAGQTVNVYADNVLIGSAVADGGGVFLLNFDPNTVYAANPVLILATTSGAVTGDYLGKFYGPVGNLDIVNNTVTVRSDTGGVIQNSEVAGEAFANSYVGSGNNVVLNSGVDFLTTAGVVYSPVFTTTNTPYDLNGNITLGKDVTFNGTVIVTAPSTIMNTGNTLFNSTLDGPSDLTILSTGSVTFEDVVGITTNTLGILNVTGSQININTTDVAASGAQNYTGVVNLTSPVVTLTTGSDVTFNSTVEGPGELIVNGNMIAFGDMGTVTPLNGLTVNGNASGSSITSASSVFITGNFTLLSNDIYNVTGTLTFGGDVNGPWNLTTNVSGDVIFNGDVGNSTPLNILTINGTTSFNKGSLQTVTTHGSQIYTNTVTLNNDAQLFTLDPGPLGASIVSFGANAAGVSGPAFNLTVMTNNPANGPTGAGITGTVDVNSLTIGGMGGANLSADYPTSESFVAGQGNSQAFANTVVAPYVPTSLYCVNNFCTTIPVPPAPPVNPFPTNIPPAEIFGVPTGLVSCEASGCTNLELIMDNFAQAGTVTCVLGFAVAVDQNGNTRILMAGDTVYAGERVNAESGSMLCVKSLDGRKECMTAGKGKMV